MVTNTEGDGMEFCVLFANNFLARSFKVIKCRGMQFKKYATAFEHNHQRNRVGEKAAEARHSAIICHDQIRCNVVLCPSRNFMSYQLKGANFPMIFKMSSKVTEDL